MAAADVNDSTPLLDPAIAKTIPSSAAPAPTSRPPLPLPPPAPSPEALGLAKDHPFHLRRALPADAYTVSRVASTAYAYSQFSDVLCPRRFTYWSDFIRDFHSRNHLSLLAPQKLGLVCYPAGFPQHIVGYALFGRHGSDPGAKAFRATHPGGTLYGALRRWWWTLYWGVVNTLFPSRASDGEMKAMVEQQGVDRDKRWEESGMTERWHCGSCIVLPEYQRRGLGEKMIKVGIAMAEAEGVGLVLESSVDGERLYRKVGFVRVGLFGTEWRRGGIMLWLPEWRRGEVREWECVQDGGEGKRYRNMVEDVQPEDRV